MQTKTLINLALEFPALEKSKRKALKGGSGGFQDTTGHWTFHGLSGGNWYNGGQSTMLNEVTIIGYRNPYDVTNSGSGGNSWWGNGSSGGNTGGGGDPILFNSQSLSGNLPPNNGSATQVGGLCVFKSMEIVNHFFGGNTGSATFGLQYSQIYNDSNFVNGGFNQPVAELYNFLGTYFNVNIITNAGAAVNALNNNHPVLATRYNTDGTGHEVVITGHDEFLAGNMLSVRYYYFDPQDGFYHMDGDGTFYNLIEISGKK